MGKGAGLGLFISLGIGAVLLIPQLRDKVLPKGFTSSLTSTQNQSINNLSPSQNLNFGGPGQSSSITRILGLNNGSITGTEIIKQIPTRPERIL